MANLTNYHSHCSFCDGHAPMEAFVKEAVRRGFSAYGFSSHAPLPFAAVWTMAREDMPAYLAEAARLKAVYEGRIEVCVGLEIDYLDETHNPASAYFQRLPLDYRIGSVHLLEGDDGAVVDIDCKVAEFRDRLERCFGNDLERVVRAYFGKLMRMVATGGFDIVGHADKMAYNATCLRPELPCEPWYGMLIRDYFELISARGLMVEINTKTFVRNGRFYPDHTLFPLLRELKIPVVVNSDAHRTELIDSGRPEALAALKASGFDTVMQFSQGRWREVPID